MRIVTLGTSHGDPTYCRFNSSTLIECGGSYYLFDSGAPVDALMVRGGFGCNNIRAVFITHVHVDHIGGLPVLMKAFMKHYDKNKSSYLSVTVPEKEIVQPVLDFYRAMHGQKSESIESYIGFSVAAGGNVYEDEKVTVSAVPTKHMDYCGGHSLAYVITEKSSKKTALYTGDLDAHFSDFPTHIEADVCVCECTHFKPEFMQPIMPECKFGKLIFNHIHTPWHGEDGERKLMDYCKDFPFPVSIAHDMDEFEI